MYTISRAADVIHVVAPTFERRTRAVDTPADRADPDANAARRGHDSGCTR